MEYRKSLRLPDTPNIQKFLNSQSNFNRAVTLLITAFVQARPDLPDLEVLYQRRGAALAQELSHAFHAEPSPEAQPIPIPAAAPKKPESKQATPPTKRETVVPFIPASPRPHPAPLISKPLAKQAESSSIPSCYL